MPTRGVGATRSSSTVASAGAEALPSGVAGGGPAVVAPSKALTETVRGPSGPGARVIGTLGAKGTRQLPPPSAEHENAPGWLISRIRTPLAGRPAAAGSCAETSTTTFGSLVYGAPPSIWVATTGAVESTLVTRVSLRGPLICTGSHTPGDGHSRSSASALIAYS